MARTPTKQMFPKPSAMPPAPALDGNIPVTDLDAGEDVAAAAGGDGDSSPPAKAAGHKAPTFKKGHTAPKKKMPVPKGKHSFLAAIKS